MNTEYQHKICIPVDGAVLEGELYVPEKPTALVIFSHGSGSSKLSPRNNFVAKELQQNGIVTFLFDLLTREEDKTPTYRFNIPLLTQRLVKVTKWLTSLPLVSGLPVGYFGASTGAASALAAAAVLPNVVKAIVSRGGRIDLAEPSLALVKAATLLIVGEHDSEVLYMNREFSEKLNCRKHLEVVGGASHLFEEPGALEEVAKISANWFVAQLAEKAKPHEKNTRFMSLFS
ncbi:MULTISPECIES: dienelactone hydrolase family protein [unclassified Imperialibacter]|uniref:dienelactone hydrolase family protein n=1 Tax=unclassified Imperialibacter TaxID=2629706 RepID=UPI00125A98F7|nr:MULTISPECIES: alpha/beta hydrolase [unclassified Imperialibacter]CAD5265510.1 DeoR faimly transcriptional regulator [Imperialibacter sp. 89]CAD5270344.1 DeoR faimly transcriptional regulator [Imperialibacter sp. 75]VVT09981.1 DeoR faimly transcriptional regulator [Imperialibacter sp. EC-SDR9]